MAGALPGPVASAYRGAARSGAGNGACAAGAVGRPDLYRRAIGNPPGAQEPGSFDRAGAVEAALRDCLGLPPVS